MIGRILLTLALLAVAGFVLLVLIGLWDPYEQETGALGFSGIYERYLASQAGFADDPKAYRAVVEAEHTRTAVIGAVAADMLDGNAAAPPSSDMNVRLFIRSPRRRGQQRWRDFEAERLARFYVLQGKSTAGPSH